MIAGVDVDVRAGGERSVRKFDRATLTANPGSGPGRVSAPTESWQHIYLELDGENTLGLS